MARKKNLLLVDFDDTLFFTKEGIELSSKEVLGRRIDREAVRKLPNDIKEKIYKLAQSKYTKYSKLNKTLYKVISKSVDYDIFILTARTNKTRIFTEKLLSTNRVNYDELIIRKSYKIKDELWKSNIVKKLSKSYKKIKLYDDKEDNICYISENNREKNIEFYIVSNNKIERYKD
ncbi:MAG: hypothetical protein KGI06_04560 [Candidatus Micrarchaeota archaeon]|nr:hypothetical protein [Candidatus Micrarchaeota archaeon]